MSGEYPYSSFENKTKNINEKCSRDQTFKNNTIKKTTRKTNYKDIICSNELYPR